MQISDDEIPSDSDFEEEDEDEESDWDGESESDSESSYGVFEEARARFSNLSVLKKSRSRARNTKDLEAPEIDLTEVDEKSYETVLEIVKAGQLEKLKVDQCKVYLRKNKLRLSGNKDTLIHRIREHLEILNGEGDKKYPPYSFVLNCKGDACMGDVVMFEQNVYDMYNVVSRSAAGPPCGKRTVAGRIVKESYGSAKQQHTFTIEILWSKGEKPLPPLHPLLIKGRNLYRLKTLRRRWKDEGERQKVLNEKHSRGNLARSDREVRVQEKGRRKQLKKNRVRIKEEPNKSQPLSKPTAKAPVQNPPVYPQPGFTRQPSCQHNLHQQPYYSMNHLVRIKEEPNKSQPLSKPTAKAPVQNPPVYPQPGFTRQPSCQPNLHQQPYYSMNHIVQYHTIETHMQNSDHYHSIYREPYRQNVVANSRQPLRDMNYAHPPRRPQACYQQRQACRLFAQGRCHFGVNCKFAHEPSSHV